MWDVRSVAQTASTNADVLALARDGAPEGTVVVADHQTAGRGRLDRSWQAPPGTSLAVSFLLRPVDVPHGRWPWLPLLAGVATAHAAGSAGADAGLKWPNDVLVGEQKLSGLLVERVETPDGAAAVVGIGLNLTQRRDQLPPNATSLQAETGRPVQRDTFLAVLGEQLAQQYADWRRAGGDPAHGLAEAYGRRCVTLGREVRAELPAGEIVEGLAAEIDAHGRLVVDTGAGRVPIGAGDLVHLRGPRPEAG